MKGKIIIGLALVFASSPAYADVYVAVDANGNAVGGAIVCDAATCGQGSEFSQLTLQAGQKYVLQGTGHSGIGNNNPNVQVKVDLQTNDWTITRTEIIGKPSEPNDNQTSPVQTQIIDQFNPIGPVINPVSPANPLIFIETQDKTISILDEELDLTWNWEKILAWLIAWFDKYWSNF